jgi:hypothetical protein
MYSIGIVVDHMQSMGFFAVVLWLVLYCTVLYNNIAGTSEFENKKK